VGQDLVAKHYYRPRDPDVLQRHASKFAKLDLFTLEELFGSWREAQRKHFDDGAIFDQLYLER
jgi:sulfate transport system substrate-binding protein